MTPNSPLLKMIAFAGLSLPLTTLGETIGLASDITVYDDPVCAATTDISSVLTTPVIRVVSINLAHGRGTGVNQMLQSGKAAKRNIAESARVLNSWDADIVALQEADAASSWSGNFDHVESVADATGYGCRHHGTHAESRLFKFGTALLARSQFTKTATVDFPPTPPTTRKGFVAAQVLWNPNNRLEEPVELTLVSVHLDFSRKSSRERQFQEMTAVLAEFPRPLIIMGDLNTEWDAKDLLLQNFVSTMNLTPHAPDSDKFGTYDDGEKRLDWILVSDELMFSNYEVITDIVSDHQPVMATIHFTELPNQAPSSEAGEAK